MSWKDRYNGPHPGDRVRVMEVHPGEEEDVDFGVDDVLILKYRTTSYDPIHGYKWCTEAFDNIWEDEFEVIK